jgi:hypothetical protein
MKKLPKYKHGTSSRKKAFSVKLGFMYDSMEVCLEDVDNDLQDIM